MKNLRLIYAFILAFTLQFATAQNYILTSVAKYGSTYLNAAEDSLLFDYIAGEKVVEINSNIDFQPQSDADWCKVAKDGATLKISVEPNNDIYERTTLVTIKSKDGHVQIIDIKQYGTPLMITVAPTEINLVDTTEFVIEVTSNFVPTFDCPEWITTADTAVAGTKQYKFTASELSNETMREGIITISGADEPVNIKVTQRTDKYPTFAVISDVHFGNSNGEGPMVKVPRALKNISSYKKLDAIFVVGDLTQGGIAGQYEQLVSVFTDEDNFTNPIEQKIFMMGNHDNYVANSTYKDGLKAFNDGKEYPLDQYIVIKGYPFITISLRNGVNNDDASLSYGEGCYPKEVQDTLASWMARAAKECPGKPIFVFTHMLPRYTCYGAWPGEGDEASPTWSMRPLNPILNKYPQAVVFCGHTHFPLGDPRTIHQGVDPNSDKQNYYTVINTSSTTYGSIHGPSVDEGTHPAGSEHVTEGMIVDIQPCGNVEVRRYNTKLNEEILPDNRWLLKAPFDGSQFAYADIRDTYDNIYGKELRTGLPAPQFAAEAAVKVESTASGVSVTFPQASDNEVVHRYKIQIVNSKGYAVKNNWIFSQYYRGSEMPDSLTVSFSGLEVGAEYTATVQAYDSYENASDKLSSEKFVYNLGDVTIPTRIGWWNFENKQDTLKSGQGNIQLTPGNVTDAGLITMQETLSEANFEYIDGPTTTNGALFVKKGAMFKIEIPEDLSTYSFMFDVKIPDYSNFRSLIQTTPANNDDTDICINKSGGIGIAALGYHGKCLLDTWHRIIVSVNNGAPSIYLDGAYVGGGGISNERWVLKSKGAYLFCDNDGNTADFDIAEIAMWDTALNGAQVAAIGVIAKQEESLTASKKEVRLLDEKEFSITVASSLEPSFALPEWVHLVRPVPSMGSYTYVFVVDAMPEGVYKRTGELVISAPEGSEVSPLTVQVIQKDSNGEVPAANGLWTFDDTENLLMNGGDSAFAMQPGHMNGTEVTMTDILGAGIQQIDGPSADNKAIFLPEDILLNMQIVATSDEKIRDYTIMYDVREYKNNDFNALLQTDLSNSTDLEFCINENGYIGFWASGNWGYGGQIYAGRWHRIVLTVKDGVPNAYLDGALVTPGKNDFNGIWCLDPQGCYLFGDDSDGRERMEFEVAEIRYWNETLSSAQVAKLGEVDYKYIYSDTKKVDIVDKEEFTIDVKASVIPEFVLPEWIKPVDVTPTTGYAIYTFKADSLVVAGAREGTITIKDKDGDDVIFVTIPVVQERTNGGVPACTGKWLFDNADDLYTSIEGNAQLIPCKIGADNTTPTVYDSYDDATVEVIDEGITLRTASCFKLELNEAENLSYYTVTYDVRISNYVWRGLLQTNFSNNADGVLYINKSGQVGHRTGGLDYSGSVSLNKWCRITLVVKDGYAFVYINGKFVKSSTSKDSKWNMDKTGAFLFCDNNREVGDIDISGLYFWNKALTDEQIAIMGATNVGVPACAGKWLFDNADDLYTSIEGSAQLIPYKIGANYTAPTMYESPADATVEVIEEGITLRKASCFKLELNEAENLSNYTITYDVRIANHAWRNLIQQNLNNNSGGGLYISPTGTIGLNVSGLGYSGSVPTNEWFRVTFVVKDGYAYVYINGEFIKASTSSNNKWIMDKTGAFLFCDDNGEINDLDIKGLYFWNKALTDEQIAAMGTIE